MATMLRSLRFVRRFNAAGAALRLSAPPAPLRRAELVNSQELVQCLAATVSGVRNYVTEVQLASTETRADSAVEMINNLNQKLQMRGNLNVSDIEEVLDAVTRAGFITSNQALFLIRCCGNALSLYDLKTRKHLVDAVWKCMEALGVHFDVSHYNALILIHLQNETDFSPFNILMEMKEKNIEPNRVTFQRLIEQYCNRGDIAGATKILEYMNNQGVPITENIFNCLIKGHSEAGDVSNAIKILDIMKQAGIEPTVNSYIAVLCVHAKRGDIDAIRSTLDECKEKKFELLDKDILKVIETLACNGHENHIDELLSLSSKGVTYNRDLKSQIFRLLDKNLHGAAYKLLKSMVQSPNTSTSTNTNGYFFLKKLVLNDTNVDVIINYCKLMKEDKLNDKSFEVAVHATYFYNMHHLALPLMKAWKENGGIIRENYFYPVFTSFGKNNNLQGIESTLHEMVFNFNIQPSIECIKDYIMPFMVEDPFSTVATLVNNGLLYSNIVNAMAGYLLKKKTPREASKFVHSTSFIFQKRLLIRHLVSSFLMKKDVKSLCAIVHHQYVLISNEVKNVEDDQFMSAEEFSSSILGKVVEIVSTYDSFLVQSILEEFLNYGIRINTNVAAKVDQYYGGTNLSIKQILDKLTSETLSPKPLDTDNKNIKRISTRRASVKYLQKESSNSPELKMLLAQEYAKMRNRETVENLIQEMEQDNVNFNTRFCLSMIEFYSKCNNSSAAADKWYKRLKEMHPDYEIPKEILLHYANSLVYDNRITDAWQVLEDSKHDETTDRNFLSEQLLRTVYQVCPENLNKTFDILIKKKFLIKVKSSTVNSLVKIHLNQGDLYKAVEQFKWLWQNYQVLPMKMEILKKLIEKEDVKTLQYITDISTTSQGESRALHDLAIAFLECGRQRQARKILETPGLKMKKDCIMYNAERYYKQRRTDMLEKLIYLTAGLYRNIDEICLLALRAYENEGEWRKCLSLWTQMQEDNIQPTATFMCELERILTSYNQTVPFAESPEFNKYASTELQTAIDDEDLEKAENIIQKASNQSQTTLNLQLLEKYMAKGDLETVIMKINGLLDSKQAFTPAYNAILEPLFEKLIDNNDFEKVFEIVLKFRTQYESLNKNLPVTRLFNQIVMKTGKFEEFLNALDGLLSLATSAGKERLSYGPLMHAVTIIRGLKEDPARVEQLRVLALKAKEFRVLAPINIYWIYLFIENNPDAENVWENHIKDLRVYFCISAILACKDNGCLAKLPVLAEKLVNAKISDTQKRKNYATMLQTVIKSDEPKKYEIAFECLQHAVKAVPLRLFNRELINEIEWNLPSGQTLESLRPEKDGRESESASG